MEVGIDIGKDVTLLILHYMNDIVLLAKDENDLQQMIYCLQLNYSLQSFVQSLCDDVI